MMSLTCHFIDKKWYRRQVILNSRVMHGSYTGEYTKDTFLHMPEEWEITKKCVPLVLQENGANMVKGMRHSDIPDRSCTAH